MMNNKFEDEKKNQQQQNIVMCAVFEGTHFNLPFQVKISNNFDGIFQNGIVSKPTLVSVS